MELGVALPTSGRLASPGNIVRIAEEAERLGRLEPAPGGAPGGLRGG